MENKIKLLIVEDEALIAENIRYMVEDLGFDVVDVCYNYDCAIASLSQNSFDIALLDINLSGDKTGFDIAAQINLASPRKPFIFLTAYNDKDSIKKAASLQPAGYINKPVTMPVLFANIQIAIENFILKREPVAESDTTKPTFFYAKYNNKAHKILWKDVYCLESVKNYVKLKTADNKIGFLIRGSLQYVLDNLMPPNHAKQYLKVSRNTALLSEFISSYDSEFAYVGNEKYSITETMLKVIEERFEKK